MKKIILGSLAIAVFSFTGCPDPNTNANRMNSNMNSNLNSNVNLPNANAMNSNSTYGNMANSNRDVSSSADQFMTEAAQGGIMEVKLGQLASTKAQNAEVKAFGKKMVEDHTKANNDLKALAAKKKVEIPTEMAESQQREYDRLSKLSGAEFDKEYVKLMVADHDGDVEAFQDQADDAEDADLKAFAAKYAPIIKSHYDMIKAINDKME